MFRLPVLIVSVLLSSLSSVALGQSGNLDICEDLYNKYITCDGKDQNTTQAETKYDADACTECASGFFLDYDRTSCAEATDEVCAYYDKCNDVCMAGYRSTCQEELLAYVICAFGITSKFAPADCLVSCDGATGSTGNQTTGSDGNGKDQIGGGSGNNSGRDSTSDGPGRIVLSALHAAIIIVAAVLLYR